MTIPTSPSKRFYVCGLKQQTGNWGAPIALGAGDGLLVNSDGNPALKQAYESADALLGHPMPLDGDLGEFEAIDWSPEFGGKCGLQYAPGAIGSAIAALFGICEVPASQGGDPEAFKHVFMWADEMSDFFTFATSRPGDIWEVPSCVPTKLSLKVGSGKLQGSIGLRGNLLNNDSDTNTDLAAVTPESAANFIKSQTGILRMNAQSAGALAAPTDVVIASDLEVEYERVVDAQISLGGTYIAQPKELNFKINVKIKLPYADGSNVPGYFSVFKGMIAQKMDIVFTGGAANAATKYSLTFGFPRLKLVTPPDVKLEDIIKNGLEFVAEQVAGATGPDGMTAYTRPFIELVNLRSTKYIA